MSNCSQTRCADETAREETAAGLDSSGQLMASSKRHAIAAAVGEIVLLAAGWHLYRYGRFRVRDQRLEAFANATDIIAIERRLEVFVEPHVQRLALASQAVIEVLNSYYVYMHGAATIACLCWLYCWHRPHYHVCRRVLFTVMALGLAIHAVYPLAPPRVVPRANMVDTLAVFGPSVYSRDQFASITNQFAAMPSFHVGWAALVAYYLIRHGRSRLRWAALAHPIVMTIAVVATANHYLLDAAVGTGLVLGGIHLDRRIHTRSARHPPVTLPAAFQV